MIRPAGADDYDAIAELFQELGADGPPPTRERWEHDDAPETLVYDDGRGVIGYIQTQAAHVFNLAVARPARGAGVGRVLMLAAATRMRAAGLGEWHLNVKADNTPAIRLYERLGMTRRYASAVLTMPWDLALPAASSHAVTLPIEPGDDAELEARFGLLAGRLARARGRGRVLLQLREHDLPVGVGVLDRDGRLLPLRLARPALLSSLLGAARPHARGSAQVRLMIEADEALVAMGLDAGARLMLRLLHYAGSIPAHGGGA